MVNSNNKRNVSRRKYPVRSTRNKRPTNDLDFLYEELWLDTCDLCHIQCKNEQDLLKHRAKHATVSVTRLSICKECLFYTTSPMLMKHHVTTHQPVVIKSENEDEQGMQEPTCKAERLAPDPVKTDVKSVIPDFSLFEKPVPIRSRIIFEDDDYNVALLSLNVPAIAPVEFCQPQLGLSSCPMKAVPAPSIEPAVSERLSKLTEGQCVFYEDLIQPERCVCELCGTQFGNMFLLLQHNLIHMKLNIFELNKPDVVVTPIYQPAKPITPAENQTVEEKPKERIAKPNLESLNILRNSLKEGSDYKTCSSCFRYVRSTGLHFKLLHFVSKNRVTQMCDICKDKFTLIINLRVLKPEQKRYMRKTNLDRLTNICRRLNPIRRRVRNF